MTQLITNRRLEVEAAIARLLKEIDLYKVELAELQTAERVLNRLSGANGAVVSAQDKPAAAATAIPVSPHLTMPQMIVQILAEAQFQEGRIGLTPKEINSRVEKKFGISGKAEQVSSICWRMFDRGNLKKPDKDRAVYSLDSTSQTVIGIAKLLGIVLDWVSGNEKAVNTEPSRAALTASIHSSAGGDETVRGGGT
jgi:hypothetical protein